MRKHLLLSAALVLGTSSALYAVSVGGGVPNKALVAFQTNTSSTNVLGVQTNPFNTNTVATGAPNNLAGADQLPGSNTFYVSGGNNNGNVYTATVGGSGVTLLGSPGGGVTLGGLSFDNDGTTLWAVGGTGLLNDTLYTVNTTTGAATAVGPLGAVGLDGIATHPDTNVLYATSGFAFDGSPGDIFTISKTTGLATKVGQMNPVPGAVVAGLDFDNDGTLWAGLGGQNGSILAVDEATGSWDTAGDAGSRSASAVVWFRRQ